MPLLKSCCCCCCCSSEQAAKREIEDVNQNRYIVVHGSEGRRKESTTSGCKRGSRRERENGRHRRNEASFAPRNSSLSHTHMYTHRKAKNGVSLISCPFLPLFSFCLILSASAIIIRILSQALHPSSSSSPLLPPLFDRYILFPIFFPLPRPFYPKDMQKNNIFEKNEIHSVSRRHALTILFSPSLFLLPLPRDTSCASKSPAT